MEKIKAGKPLIEFVKLCYAANMPPLLCGNHGVGKSELLRHAAAELGIAFISRDLSLMEPPDLIGLPKMNGTTTMYLPPAFLPTGGKGILVFEELNRCERYMRAPTLQLLTDRSLNDYRLPTGWLPAAAINPPDKDYEVFDLDAAVLSRFAQGMVIPDQQGWIEWAQQNSIHPAVVEYVGSDDSIFDHTQSNPRAWKYVSDLSLAAENDHTPAQLRRGYRRGRPKAWVCILAHLEEHSPLIECQGCLARLSPSPVHVAQLDQRRQARPRGNGHDVHHEILAAEGGLRGREGESAAVG